MSAFSVSLVLTLDMNSNESPLDDIQISAFTFKESLIKILEYDWLKIPGFRGD